MLRTLYFTTYTKVNKQLMKCLELYMFHLQLICFEFYCVYQRYKQIMECLILYNYVYKGLDKQLMKCKQFGMLHTLYFTTYTNMPR